MGHKTITEKLDQIQKEDLGVHFDQSLLWDELESQLDKKPILFNTRLLVAACITLLMLLLPLVFLKDAISPSGNFPPKQTVEIISPVDSAVVEIANQAPGQKAVLADKPNKQPKEIIDQIEEPIQEELLQANAVVDTSAIDQLTVASGNKPEIRDKKEEPKRRVFASQDISIIQASLEKPTIEREKRLAIIAQLQTDSRPSDVLFNKELKFTLYAKQE